MNNTTTLVALAAACALLAGCGGSGDSTGTPPPAQTFSFTPPALGATDTWSRVLTDNLGTSVAMQIRLRVTQQNQQGAMVYTYDDPTGVDVVQDGLTFRTTPETADVNSAGTTLDYTNTHVDGTQVTCTYAYGQTSGTAASLSEASRQAAALGLRHLESISVGQSWTTSYTVSCAGETPVTFNVSANVQPVESVTVPAGTFQAVKENVSATYISGGVTYTSTTTLWRDPANSLFSVKSQQSITRSDTSQNWIAQDVRELLSHQ